MLWCWWYFDKSSLAALSSVISEVARRKLGLDLYCSYLLSTVLFAVCMKTFHGSYSPKMWRSIAYCYGKCEFCSSRLQHTLDLVTSWTDKWQRQLELAPTECKVIRLILSKQPQYPPALLGNSLSVITKCSDLGASYDEHPRWAP